MAVAAVLVVVVTVAAAVVAVAVETAAAGAVCGAVTKTCFLTLVALDCWVGAAGTGIDCCFTLTNRPVPELPRMDGAGFASSGGAAVIVALAVTDAV